jgi:hypothetical protein
MAVVTMQAAQLFENRAVAGAAFEVDGGSLTLTNVLTAWNEATDTGGSVYAIDATLVMTNTASGEDDSPNAGGLYLSGTSTGTVMNAAFYGSNTGWCVSVDSTATYTGSYDNAYDCLAGRYTGITDPTGTSGNLAVAPGFVSVTADGDHTNDDWHLLATSAMLNFGNPAAAYNDADGTRNDIGAYGGPGSDWD